MTCPNCGHSMVKMYFYYFDRTPPEWHEWYCAHCGTRIPVSPRKNACKDCKYRSPGCHARCEEYKALFEMNQEHCEKKRHEARLNNYVNEAIIRVKAAKGGWHAYRKKGER